MFCRGNSQETFQNQNGGEKKKIPRESLCLNKEEKSILRLLMQRLATSRCSAPRKNIIFTKNLELIKHQMILKNGHGMTSENWQNKEAWKQEILSEQNRYGSRIIFSSSRKNSLIRIKIKLKCINLKHGI